MEFESQATSIFEDSPIGESQIMRTDIQEKEGNYLLEIELPGFPRENVQAELKNGTLTIIAKRPETIEKEENKIHYIRRERMIGEWKRSFFVGNDIRQEDITAAFKDGVLSIIISNPEKKVAREERKLIPIH